MLLSRGGKAGLAAAAAIAAGEGDTGADVRADCYKRVAKRQRRCLRGRLEPKS